MRQVVGQNPEGFDKAHCQHEDQDNRHYLQDLTYIPLHEGERTEYTNRG